MTPMIRHLLRLGLLACVVGAAPARAFAQTDEIQVYTAEIAAKGVFNLTLHTNFIADGNPTPAFPGAVTADHSLNGVPEWAYGVATWFEAGLYMPLYSRDRTMGWGLNGYKLRALFVVPHAADRKFVFGANFEFSFNNPRWDTSRHTAEVRPIIGWHLKPIDIIINPIVDTAWDGFGNLEFVPSMRVAYNKNDKLAFAVEEYADFGPLRKFRPAGQQVHQLYGVLDYSSHFCDIEAGVGFGLTSASDKYTLKLILSRDLNKKK